MPSTATCTQATHSSFAAESTIFEKLQSASSDVQLEPLGMAKFLDPHFALLCSVQRGHRWVPSLPNMLLPCLACMLLSTPRRHLLGHSVP